MNTVSKFPKNLKPQFKAKLRFHFREKLHKDQRQWFLFQEDGHRKVPMEMVGVEGLNTVGMWTEDSQVFRSGDETLVDCMVIWEEAYRDVVRMGVKFELWDGGFFAEGEVIHRYEEGWTCE